MLPDRLGSRSTTISRASSDKIPARIDTDCAGVPVTRVFAGSSANDISALGGSPLGAGVLRDRLGFTSDENSARRTDVKEKNINLAA
jgi:hypothetical protein